MEKGWQWVGQDGSSITKQSQRLGASCDWSWERFTLDPGPSKAVRTTVVNLYRKGLIYRGERIINWCPRCATALSDLEVNHTDEQGLRQRFLPLPPVQHDEATKQEEQEWNVGSDVDGDPLNEGIQSN